MEGGTSGRGRRTAAWRQNLSAEAQPHHCLSSVPYPLVLARRIEFSDRIELGADAIHIAPAIEHPQASAVAIHVDPDRLAHRAFLLRPGCAQSGCAGCAHKGRGLRSRQQSRVGALQLHTGSTQENAIEIRGLLLASAAAAAITFASAGTDWVAAQSAAALSGQVSSAEEGAMEGVVV